MNLQNIAPFVHESNRIEGIVREIGDAQTIAELRATAQFIELGRMSTNAIAALVGVFQPDAVLRDKPGLNVRVGPHVAPRGGPAIVKALDELAEEANDSRDPYDIHCRYETLHPFTDGNGRSGRALWLWQMHRLGYGTPSIGFLHTWYYQSLQGFRK